MVSVSVGGSGTPKHAFLDKGASNSGCAFLVGNGWYCALPKDDSVHSLEPGEPFVNPLGKAFEQMQGMLVPLKVAAEIRFPDHPTVQGVAAYFEECTELVRTKNAMYGDAWKRQGYMGNLGRVLSKTARLEAMLWRDQGYADTAEEIKETDESIEDTLRDLANLTAFMYRNYQDGNRWGK